tara:strand:- start:987 stop:1337 length:351 start_codon:yes stop_codon:yes gene_type:complete
MSTPITECAPYEAAAHAVLECMSASSSLAMFPEPIEDPQGDFLYHRDRGAEHAAEHLQAACRHAAAADEEYKRVRDHLLRPILRLVKDKEVPREDISEAILNLVDSMAKPIKAEEA